MAASLLPWNECLKKGLALFNDASVPKKVVIAVVAVSVTWHFVRRVVKHRRRCNRKNDYPRDTVILHQLPRGIPVPSISPFVLKLETYLRIAKIPYQIDTKRPFGPKGKTPWITYNEDDIPDSTLCIEYLNKKFKVNLNEGLSQEQIAVARSLQIMAEDHLFWALALHRFVYDKTKSFLRLMRWQFPVPNVIFAFFFKRVVLKRSKAQGTALHSQEVVTEFARRDLKAFSDYLANKAFFFGSEVTEADCALFGMLAQAVWTAPPGTPVPAYLDGEFLNLKEYCYRMKELAWPDWDKCLDKTVF